MKQINIRNDGIWGYGIVDGNFIKIWETALKSDLSDNLKIVGLKSDTITFAANSTQTVSIPLVAQSGYALFWVIDAYAEGSSVMVSNRYVDGSTVKINTRNVTTTQAAAIIHASVLYKKI